MFHNFHDRKKHKKIQGSLSSRQLEKIIKFIGRENILSPDDFFKYLSKDNKQKKKIKNNLSNCLFKKYSRGIR